MIQLKILYRWLYTLPLVMLLGCMNNKYYDPAKAHHIESGFRNIDYVDDKGFVAFAKWRWQKLFKDIPDVAEYHFPIDVSRHDFVQHNQHKFTLTWIGHATFLIQINGKNILTDPHFTERASPLSWVGPRRVVEPAIPLNKLPEIDAVIISHDHYDSLDEQTIRQLVKHNQLRAIQFIVPLGIKPWLDSLDIAASGVSSMSVIELDWGGDYEWQGLRFIAEPGQHWGKRSLFDAYDRLWASWVIEAGDKRIFFAGDTGYADHFRKIGKKYGAFDLALLPIGAYEPRWCMKPYHVNPEEAVKIHQDINSHYSVAMHWGTFILTDEPLDEPPQKLHEALLQYHVPETEFEVYRHGQVHVFDD